jgi:hypothetical protein
MCKRYLGEAHLADIFIEDKTLENSLLSICFIPFLLDFQYSNFCVLHVRVMQWLKHVIITTQKIGKYFLHRVTI